MNFGKYMYHHLVQNHSIKHKHQMSDSTSNTGFSTFIKANIRLRVYNNSYYDPAKALYWKYNAVFDLAPLQARISGPSTYPRGVRFDWDPEGHLLWFLQFFYFFVFGIGRGWAVFCPLLLQVGHLSQRDAEL
jgi:hypothetical protein